jgi:hypothetical protein
MPDAHEPPRPLSVAELLALADRVWARQAPSSRWLVVRVPTDTEDDP